MGISLGGQPAAHRQVGAAALERREQLRVSLGPHDHHDRIVVLGSGTDHRRAADVDLLHRLLERNRPLADRFHERVEVAADQVDPFEPKARERLHVSRLVAPREDARVDAGVQRFDAAVHHLGKSGQVGDRMRVDRRLVDRAQRVARCIELEPEALKAAREPGQPALRSCH